MPDEDDRYVTSAVLIVLKFATAAESLDIWRSGGQVGRAFTKMVRTTTTRRPISKARLISHLHVRRAEQKAA
jgi:hypothetical protein